MGVLYASRDPGPYTASTGDISHVDPLHAGGAAKRGRMPFMPRMTGARLFAEMMQGSLSRVVTFPPDAVWKGKVGAKKIAAYFAATGSPGASTCSNRAPHPYPQKTFSLDFCLVLEGEITLVLDTEEVALTAGDTVVQRGTSHAWSNRSGRPCTVAFTSHDGYF